jgi:dTDP-4-amino-4,6-dideoxygalactose transaminase
VELDRAYDQRTVMQRMLDAGVSTRRGVMNSHLERPYESTTRRELPWSERAQQRGVILPLVPGMTTAQVRDVCGALGAALGVHT